ncbi:hypothetical protein [Prosthecobacter sp.]|uniref:hypothetical protein n=1 Tax=Prosthecobacter sp. TaxID=1965333 RepID=UPI0037832BFB
MRSVLRIFAAMILLTVMEGHGRSEIAAAAPSPAEENDVQRWNAWWMNEALRQSLPVPQLLFFDSYPGRPGKSATRNGSIWVPEEFKILYFYPLCFPDRRYSWRYQSNTDWLNTEAFVMPSVVGIQNYSCYESRRMIEATHQPLSYARLQLFPLWQPPVFDVHVPEEYGGAFSWLKKMRAPSAIRPVTYSLAHCEDVSSLGIPLPKRLSAEGENLWRKDY